MKNFPYTSNTGPRIRTRSVVGHPTGGNGVTITVEEGPSTWKSVTAGPIVSGNRSDPNDWAYTVDEGIYLRGFSSKSSYYTAGASRGATLTITDDGCVAYNTTHRMYDGVVFPPNLHNQALSALNEKVRGTIDLSVDLAQAGSTARMFSVSNKMEHFVRTFRGWRGLIKGISDARLEFAYGWRPLAQTLYDAADESVNVVISKIEAVKSRRSSPVPSGIQQVKTWPLGNSAPVLMTRSGKFVVEYGLKFKTGGHSHDRWSSLNPVSIAWELVPYSFVVDWLVDVGSYLRNLETSLLYANSFVSGYCTVGTFYDVRGSVGSTRVATPPGYIDTYSTSATCSARYRSLARSKLTSYPAPRPPRFEADLSTSRLLNLASLIGSKLRVKS